MGVEAATAALIGGAVATLAASWALISRLERLGERFGLSEGLLGFIAAVAADTPEITAAVVALVEHQRTVGTGVIIGSNIFKLAALLGLGAVVAGRVGLHRKVVILGGSVSLWVAIVCLLTVMGLLVPSAGLLLVLAALVPYLVAIGTPRTFLRRLPLPGIWADWLASAVEEEELELEVAIRPQQAHWRDGLVAVVALAIVVGASALMERGASVLGVHFGVAEIVVGGLVLAATTSLPNAVAAVHLAAQGRGAATLSTALNSNSVNVLVGLLIPATLVGLARPSGAGLVDAGWYVGLTLTTLLLAYWRRGLARQAGWLIIVGYLAFVATLLAVS